LKQKFVGGRLTFIIDAQSLYFKGLCFFTIIFINKRFYSLQLVTHEQIHRRQQLETLFLAYFIYFFESTIKTIRYGSISQGISNVSFEREAYANQDNPEYLKTRPFWAFLYYM
jgi:hypothetical protein